ncbi:3-coathanger stack domain-containing protein [Chryseobacterium sp.]|uniref:3-coathanger stack domain-containing protein n=1 Tax=Chryseobacterium sp. TaxID=1871047 RepID=UPI002FC7595D
MKTKYFIIIFLFFLGLKNYHAQTANNSDVIILLDNSGSIDSTEFVQMQISSNLLIENLLKCKNRVSVIHYSTSNNNQGLPSIYIESDFTSNPSTALNFSRRFSGSDYLHESISLIANALDNVINPNIISPQQTLNKTPSTPLIIFVFTDAYRAAGGSNLVNILSPSISTIATPNNNAFNNFTNFKNNRNATFVVVHISPEVIANNAAAGIASLGGNYTGDVEPYPADPNYLITPRLYYPQTSFILNNSVIQNLTNNICNVSRPAYIDYVFEPVTCFNSYLPYSVFGNYYLPPGTNLVSINMTMENINTGINYPVSSPVNILSTTEYKFDLNQSNLDPSMPLSGQYVFRISMIYNNGTSTSTLVGNNLYSIYYYYDTNFDCCSGNPNLYITAPVTALNTDSQAASDNIFASNIINSTANAVYHAGTSVVLKENFHAKLGSNFHAFIQPCVDPSVNKSTFDFKNVNTTPNDYQIITKNSYSEKAINSFTDEDIKISPNPASTFINIDSGNEKITSWDLLDISGRSILKGSSNKVNVQGLPKTTYLLNININNKTTTKKVIVK